jgi:serine/threonine-protein kinase
LASLPPQIAKYQILRRLGHGGMGAVYLGRDPDLDRSVAIKMLREPMADEELLQRFLREARAAANLRHENLITIYEVGTYDQQPFIAMEYVDGATLGDSIKKRQPLPLVQKLSYIEQICSGLYHAHRVGIVHRDIKPANLMVDAQGVIRILDFGIARVANSGMTSDGALIGTLNYMSPEQMLGQPVDFRSDIFSVGAVAYELLSYQQAFPGSLDDGLLHRLPQMPPASLSQVCPGLPSGLEAIVMRALAKAPLERFADLEEMRSAVRHLRVGVDPRLEVETIVIPSRDKAKQATAPASSAERRGLLERRARQIAIHRDAARAALLRGDLDSAAAACDDALTLDPDDSEATRLLVEIQKAKALQDQESQARRERDRSMRQRVADAEVTLGRGDVMTAARLLEEVFETPTSDPAALALLDKVRNAATAAGVLLPNTLNVAVSRTRTEAPVDATRIVHRTEPEPQRSRLPLYAAAALAVVAIGGGAVWFMSGNESAPPTHTAAPPPEPPSSTAPAPTSTEAVPVAQAPASTATPPATAVTTPAPAVASAPAPAATTNAPAAAADALAPTLARITQLQQSGDVASAVSELARIGSTTDNRVSALAQSVAQSAFRTMGAAQDAAVSQKASDLAPASYANAEQARRLADAASGRSEFAEAARRALAASELYRKAESDARAAAAVAAARTPEPTPSRPAPAPEAPLSSRAEVAPAPAPPAATTAPRPSALDNERAGIVRALTDYQQAYRSMNVDALRKVYPNLTREAGQDLAKAFRQCRLYDVTFGNMDVALAGDPPTTATVTVQSEYLCQPKTAQQAVPQKVEDIFRLQKVAGAWVIDRIAMADSRRR